MPMFTATALVLGIYFIAVVLVTALASESRMTRWGAAADNAFDRAESKVFHKVEN